MDGGLEYPSQILVILEDDVVTVLHALAELRIRDYQLRRVCPSVQTEQLGSHWTDFHEI